MAAVDLEEVMNKFHDELGAEKLKWIMGQFSGENSTRELFQFLWDMDESHRCLTPIMIKSRKSDSESERLRTEGNHFYKQKNFDKALELYNLSIMAAPHPGLSGDSASGGRDMKLNEPEYSPNHDCLQEGEYSELALGYANRSAVLLEMQLYEKCLEDISLALSHGYPKSSRVKLEERKEKCLAARMKNKRIKPSLLPGNCKSAQSILLSSYERPAIPVLDESNPVLPSFSGSVKMSFSRDKGRYIVADRDILPGEVIASEECYCSSLDLENMATYCSNCLVHCLTPLPCPGCTMVVFCSEDCRRKALSGDHRLECSILPTLTSMGMKPVFTMVYKLLKQHSFMKWRSTLEGLREQERKHPPERLGFNQDGVYSPDDYESIYHLVTNKEKRPNGDLYVKCLISFILTSLLQQSDKYFLDDIGQPICPTREDLLTMGETLFSNLMKISCNGFQLVEFQCSGPPIAMERTAIGSAVFPTLSLVNHSCNPTAVPYISGRIQTLRASRYIPAGEEVTESYCNTFYFQGTEQRQMGLLEVYQFTCSCEACQGNWPVYEELPKTMLFKCLNCSRSVSCEAPRCHNCELDYTKTGFEANKQLSIDQWWAAVQQVRSAFSRVKCLPAKVKSLEPLTEEDLTAVRYAVELMDRHVPFACQPLWDVYDALDLYFRLERSPVYSYIRDYEE